MQQGFIDKFPMVLSDEFNKLKKSLIVTDDTPTFKENEDLNDFYEGWKTCENVPLNHSPITNNFYGAILGLRINNGVRIEVAILSTNQIFMRTYQYRGNGTFAWDDAWKQIGGGTATS